MNSLFLGGAGVLATLIFLLYRWGAGKALEAVMQQTQDQDKSLQQQQLENEAKLANVNKDLTKLYEERAKLQQEQAKTDQERAESWSKPPEQH